MTHKQFLLGTVIFSLILLGLGTFDYFSSRPSQMSLAERCSMLGGEWLYRSADLLCLLPTGDRLAFDETSDAFVPFVREGITTPVAATDEQVEITACAFTPSFDDYVTEAVFAGRAQVDFSTFEEARRYRTAITKDVARGVNFAGQYVLSTWGCGEECIGSAVINAESGKILAYGLTATGYDFTATSRLLDAQSEGYYVLEDDSFNKLCN